MSSPARVFISYARADEDHCKRLAVHLAPLKRERIIASWHDRMILPGAEWCDEIDRNLASADIVVLLVSADFVASDYCYEKELQLALDRHEQGKACVVPVLVEPTDFRTMPFAKIQGLPRDAKPVSLWANRDEAWLDVATGLRRVVAALPERSVPFSQGIEIAALRSALTASTDREPSVSTAEPRRVEIVIEMEMEQFGDREQNLLQYGLARFLSVPPTDVRILEKKKGSVRLTIELPAGSDETLIKAFREQNAVLDATVQPLVVSQIRPASPPEAVSPEREDSPTARRWELLADLPSDPAAAGEVIGALFRDYHRPIYAFLRRTNDRETALDLTQGFFTSLLENAQRIQGIQRDAGSFRSWLLVLLRGYVRNSHYKMRAMERSATPPAWVDVEDEHASGDVVLDAADPERVYHRVWARTILERAMRRLEDEEIGRGREEQFRVLRARIFDGSIDTSQAGQILGMSQRVIRTALFRMRVRYRELLRAELAELVEKPSDVDAEIRDLLQALDG